MPEANKSILFPASFKDKRVHIQSVDGTVTRGVLNEIQDYQGAKLLVVPISGTTEEPKVRVVAFDHVSYIEEI